MNDFQMFWVYLKSLASGWTESGYDKDTFKAARDILQGFALYVTIALAVCLLIYAIVIRNREEAQLVKSRRTIVGIVVGYSVATIALLGFVRFCTQLASGDVNKYYWLFIGMIAYLAVALVVGLVLLKRNVKGAKWVGLGLAVGFVIFAVVVACVVPNLIEPLDGKWQMPLVTCVLVAVIVALAILGGNKNEGGYDSRALTYGAICIATAFALSYVKFFSLPQGGSVTFASMLPIILYSYMFGTRKGLIVGVVYGMLQFIQSPQFLQPVQVLLDYPIAFGALGVAGIARKIPGVNKHILAEFTVGTLISGILRFVSHVISGYYVFNDGNIGVAALKYSVAYNSFVFVDIAIVLAVGLAALSTKAMRRAIANVQTPQN